MNHQNPSYKFISRLKWPDVFVLFLIPAIIAIAVALFVYYYGNVIALFDALTNSIPVVSSIMMGFIATILVASLSESGVFHIMKEKQKDECVNMYMVFVSGLFFTFYIDIVLLVVGIIIGPLFGDSDLFTIVLGLILLLYLLVCSLVLFMKNMGRLYQVICYENR